jgi:hypothetical protein
MDHDLILSFAVIADPLSPHVPTSPLISSALTSVHRLSPNAMFTRRSLYAFFRASDLSCQCASGHCYLLALFHLIVTSHRHFSSSLLTVPSFIVDTTRARPQGKTASAASLGSPSLTPHHNRFKLRLHNRFAHIIQLLQPRRHDGNVQW